MEQKINIIAPDIKTAELIARGIFILLSFGTKQPLEYDLDITDDMFYLYIKEKRAVL